MKKISNPLTIVAIFAGIAEVAGTTVLPFIIPQLQNVFIWYVMIFPIILVILFFLTWNFNSKVLYSPNDFSDETNYMETLKLFYGIKETVEKGKESGEETNEIINKVYGHVINEIEKLNNPQNAIINLLSQHMDGMSINDIANSLQLSRTYTRRNLIRLEELEIVERAIGKSELLDGMIRTIQVYKLKK